MKSLKAKQLIDVKSYVKPSSGTVVPRHKRMDEIIVDQPIKHNELSTFLTKAEELKNDLPNMSKSEQQNRIIDLYSDGDHGVQDQGFVTREDILPEVFSETARKSKVDIFKSFNKDAVNAKQLDPDFIKEVSSVNQRLEKIFNEKLGIKTKRTNLFTFSFEHHMDGDIGESLNLAVDNKITKRTDNIANKLAGLYPNLSHLEKLYELSDKMYRRLDVSPNIGKKILTNYIPSALYGHETEPEFSTSISSKAQTDIKESLPEHMQNYSNVLGDPEITRKELLDAIKNYKKKMSGGEDVEKLNTIQKFIKGVNANTVNPHFLYMMENDKIFHPISEKQFQNEVDNIASTISSSADELTKYLNHPIYVSNNPMEFITMSPQGKITSCQSITEGGELSVNKMNVNVINSLLVNKSNDFIMFTKSAREPNVKQERTSFHLTKDDKFQNFEDRKVYSNDDNAQKLNSVIFSKNMEDNIQEINGTDQFLSYHRKLPSITSFDGGLSKIKGIHEKAIEQTKGVDKKVEKKLKNGYTKQQLEELSLELFSEFKGTYMDKVHKIQQTFHENKPKYRNELTKTINADMDKFIIDSINNGESFLYGSPASIMSIDRVFTSTVENIVINKANEINAAVDKFGTFASKLAHQKIIQTTLKQLRKLPKEE